MCAPRQAVRVSEGAAHNPVVRGFPVDQYSALPDGRVEPVPENWEIISPQCGDDGRPRAELPSRGYWPFQLRKLRRPFSERAMAIGRPIRQNSVKPIAVAAALVLGVGLAGCSGHQTTSAAPKASVPAPTTVLAPPVVAGQLAGRVFRVTRITERGADVAIDPGTAPKISFTTDHFTADMGCNSLDATYSVDAAHHLVRPMGVVSQVGCGSASSGQETRITRALRTGAALALRGDRLTISNDDITLDTTSVP